jgi:hypothetical protein
LACGHRTRLEFHGGLKFSVSIIKPLSLVFRSSWRRTMGSPERISLQDQVDPYHETFARKGACSDAKLSKHLMLTLSLG